MMDSINKPKKNWKELPPEQIAALMNRKSEGYLTGLLGFTLVSVSKERVLARMEIEKHHLAPNGYLHAASVIALADSTCGFAVSMYLPEGAEGFTTIELKTNFLGTARSGFILCEGTPAHIGRRTQVWDARVWDGISSRHIALFRCTQMVFFKQEKKMQP
jgi:1,4-dihydroxy-2-naphthoyl-CoA hydrolase